METPQTNNELEIVYVTLGSPQSDAKDVLDSLLMVLEALENSRWYPKTALPVIDIDL